MSSASVIYVYANGSEELSRFIQQMAFKYGFEWLDGSNSVLLKDEDYRNWLCFTQHGLNKLIGLDSLGDYKRCPQNCMAPFEEGFEKLKEWFESKDPIISIDADDGTYTSIFQSDGTSITFGCQSLSFEQVERIHNTLHKNHKTVDRKEIVVKVEPDKHWSESLQRYLFSYGLRWVGTGDNVDTFHTGQAVYIRIDKRGKMHWQNDMKTGATFYNPYQFGIEALVASLDNNNYLNSDPDIMIDGEPLEFKTDRVTVRGAIISIELVDQIYNHMLKLKG